MSILPPIEVYRGDLTGPSISVIDKIAPTGGIDIFPFQTTIHSATGLFNLKGHIG
jgi:hypothetical protein